MSEHPTHEDGSGKVYVTDPVLRVILMALERGALKPKEPKK